MEEKKIVRKYLFQGAVAFFVDIAPFVGFADNDGDAMDEGIGGIIGEGDDKFTLFVDVSPFAFLLYWSETLGESVGIVIFKWEDYFASGVDEAPFVGLADSGYAFGIV